MQILANDQRERLPVHLLQAARRLRLCWEVTYYISAVTVQLAFIGVNISTFLRSHCVTRIRMCYHNLRIQYRQLHQQYLCTPNDT